MAVAPSPWGQAGAVKDPTVMCAPAIMLHELLDESQKSPVADVQAPEAPQTQGAELAVAPLPWAQAGPVKVPTMKLLAVLHWLPSE